MKRRGCVPVIQRLATSGTAVSVDTRKAAVMEAALAAGARLVNDVSALTWDPRAAELVAAAGCPVVLMHHQGPPETMQDNPRYERPVLFEVYDWLEARIEAALSAGIARERIIVDPGFGFGKNVQHNLQLMNGLAMLHGLGCPIMLGASRKRTIGALANEAPAGERLGGSLAFALKAVEQGAQLLRVHDVRETVQALRVWRGLRDAALAPLIAGRRASSQGLKSNLSRQRRSARVEVGVATSRSVTEPVTKGHLSKSGRPWPTAGHGHNRFIPYLPESQPRSFNSRKK